MFCLKHILSLCMIKTCQLQLPGYYIPVVLFNDCKTESDFSNKIFRSN